MGEQNEEVHKELEISVHECEFVQRKKPFLYRMRPIVPSSSSSLYFSFSAFISHFLPSSSACYTNFSGPAVAV